ncbi:putative Atp-dependent RNA helicase [Leptomonas pyrrhocoris]|uniref:ATP-dependent RNA helicase n=1 Tax=Leptomonas pyrrhocoris TaxID=157538 RepID=A0A0M9G9I0_LEPPY|nr:putative Atp-dependent RNA helicase [Leptomonas pyrrhocoris]XP_015663809.1 putative Atp-dependent RNA helicase [Leptomonas pyrrhocoris]KPA85369.1 putative Atp-dependent RNA helicase [Leptomonas pyrrhocoris]KPA85370.1 putative Atp-dependent RNA helicase [Leptomonas pyrrhocoris]|eukprot:XP_015663808.1 putative Atp-dependent RNA helicase [Leptomonas pyrrhocoris]
MRVDRDDAEDMRRCKAKAKQRHWQERQDRSKENRDEIEQLQVRCADMRRELESIADSTEANTSTAHVYTKFEELPLSQRTMMGLERGKYTTLTPIQRESLHLALAGFDVLGAAKTGSGKTLCFVIPVLESLYREHWSADMGVGALLLSPTRELALQIFKVMQLVGHKHVHSAALLTGGRDVQEERKRLHAISIIVGTPGRVLHHLQDDAELVLDNMQLFCMDEADRLLDMGFREAITNIVKYLPPQRQTLLFSATQTTDVQMLAQMSLKNPRYVSTQAITAAPTPTTLCQNFLVVELHRKLDALLMFLKRHPHDKIVVFVSTCNQVKFMYLAFSKILKKMRIPSMCLTSKMKQFRREEVFLTFCRCKAAVLFCTDVASRGLDFPLVHWVVQYDCPESAQTYIHRAGRTARAGARGVSLLFLTPRETPMLSYLHHKNVPLREISIKADFMTSSQEIFVALVVQGLKYEAQKAFIAYLRSVYFASNKNVFEVAAIDVEAFAKSLGLLVVPDMSELTNLQRSAKNLPWDVVNFIATRSNDKGHLTRKEKHLQASDMFRVMEQKQRFANKQGALKGGEPSGDFDGTAAEHDDDDNDGFLVKKAPTTLSSSSAAGKASTSGAADHWSSSGTTKDSMHLTVDERLAGLSKNKRRKLIENPDLRVRDLGLNEHIFFKDEDEDDGDGETAARASTRAGRETAKSDSDAEDEDMTRVTNLMRGAVVHREDETDEEDGADFTSKLQHRMQAIKPDDLERAKKMRRLRRLQRQGRVSRKSTIDESGVTTESGGPRPARLDDDYNVEDSDDDASSTGSLSRLLKDSRAGADDDSDALNAFAAAEDEEDEAEFDSSNATRKRNSGKRTYHGIDSSDDNNSDVDDEATGVEVETVVRPPQKKQKRTR